MLGPPKLRCLDQPVTVSLEALVPATNFYRFLEAKLDLSFVRAWVQELYADRGRPSIDPVVFFKLQLILFFEGLRSERQLIETASLHLAHRWYLGYALDQALPDHSSLTRIRQRLGVAVFQRFFAHVVELCQEAGLVWGKELFFDATKVRANADIDSLVPRFYQRAKDHVDDLFTGDAPPAADDAGDPCARTAVLATTQTDAAAPRPLPFTGTAAEQEQLSATNAAAWKLLDEQRLDPTRPASGSYQRITDFRVSTTDPGAAPMSKGGETTLGYHDHYVVDGGKARIILAALVTPADVQDNQAMLDLLDRVRFRSHLHPRRVVADAKYGTGENLRGLAERGITAYMPLAEYDRSSPFFRQQDFTYDPEADRYTCPGGVPLTYRGDNFVTRVRIYQASTAACQACPLRERCTESKEGRTR